jgi:hypothetical protein
MSVEEKCPDGGACHHDCGASCWRVTTCAPLSGVFPDDEWPADVVAVNPWEPETDPLTSAVVSG